VTIRTTESLRAGLKTFEGIITHCEEQQRLQGREDAFVTYVLPGVGKDVKRRRMFAGKGPYGDVLATWPDGRSVVGWKAGELLAFLRPYVAELKIYLDAQTRQEAAKSRR
jgi:hypothetical protein